MAGAGVDWDLDGAPRSRLFDDVYFSKAGGLEEARAVFLAGCGLPEAWRGRSRFVVGELGFGTGLNVLALLELWRRERPPGARLNVFSVEAHPLTAQDAARALAAWPQIGRSGPAPAGPLADRAGLSPSGLSRAERRPRPGGAGGRRGAGRLGRARRRLVPGRLLSRQEPADVARGGAGPRGRTLGARSASGDLHRGRGGSAGPGGARVRRVQAPRLRRQGRTSGGRARERDASDWESAHPDRHRRRGNRRGLDRQGPARRGDHAHRRGRRPCSAAAPRATPPPW